MIKITLKTHNQNKVFIKDENNPSINLSFEITDDFKTGGLPMDQMEIEQSTFSWACSYQETQNIKINGNYPAYRIRWKTNKWSYWKKDFIVPGNNSNFSERLIKSRGDEIELGHISCLGVNFDWTGKKRIYVQIFALLPDGSELPMTDNLIKINRPPRVHAPPG